MEQFEQLESKKVFDFFKEISMIPRNSGSEQAISDHIKKFAEDRGLEVHQDKVNNLIIKKQGTSELRDAPTIILQGHMDMVCEKEAGVVHDFSTDPIEWVIKGNKLSAKGTTLGADNGIGVAFSMALLDSTDIPHPPLEVVITTDEETSMSGAEALDMSGLKGKILLNLDTEEEGKFYLSSAGGATNLVTLPLALEAVSGHAISLEIDGLLGGHSGSEIYRERANANKLMGRFLATLHKEGIDFNIQSLEGGQKDNAIPRKSVCYLVVPSHKIDQVKEITKKLALSLKEEYTPQDPDIKLKLTLNENGGFLGISKELSLKIMTILELIPYGVIKNSQYMKGLVQTSNNLGVVHMDDTSISFKSAIRSSLNSQTKEVALEIDTLALAVGAQSETFDFYAAWPYDDRSNLKNACLDTYHSLFGKEGELVAIHAGLECGIFKEKMPNLDMISFGPNIFEAHTPSEYTEIDSVDRTWIFTKALLKTLNTYI